MKLDKRITLSLLLGIIISLKSFGQETLQIVKVSNLGNVKGNLYIGWYNQAATFRLTDKAIYREKIVVNNQKELRIIFKNIPKGKYALAVFLDENDNYKLDKNIFGIPIEKYGFSNNVLSFFKPATFEESMFENRLQEIFININLK